MHLHSRQRPSFGLQGGARNDNSTFEAEVAALRKNVVSKKSKGVYSGSMVKFVQWLLENKRDLVHPEFGALYDLSVSKIKFIKTALQNAQMIQ